MMMQRNSTQVRTSNGAKSLPSFDAAIPSHSSSSAAASAGHNVKRRQQQKRQRGCGRLERWFLFATALFLAFSFVLIHPDAWDHPSLEQRDNSSKNVDASLLQEKQRRQRQRRQRGDDDSDIDDLDGGDEIISRSSNNALYQWMAEAFRHVGYVIETILQILVFPETKSSGALREKPRWKSRLEENFVVGNDNNKKDKNGTMTMGLSPPRERQPPEGNASSCRGKERLLDILTRAGFDKRTAVAACSEFPTWEEVTSLYGSEPVVYYGSSDANNGTCARYRAIFRNRNDTETIFAPEPLIGVAGLYNSGTNLLQRLLDANFGQVKMVHRMLCNDADHEVPWGKHVPAQYRTSNRHPTKCITPKHLVLPVVVVRDPYRWMKSMCNHPYEAKWERLEDEDRCPNLVMAPSSPDKTNKNSKNRSSFSTYVVDVTLQQTQYRYTDHYDSLADYWSAWLLGYYRETDYPRLMIRYEDLLFHTEKVFDEVIRCAGLTKRTPDGKFEFFVEGAKKHEKEGPGFASAMAVYGKESGRYDGFTRSDLDYAKIALDPELMRTFQYKHPHDSYVPRGNFSLVEERVPTA